MMKNSTENLVSSVRQDIFPRLKQEALNDNTELLIIFASRFRRPDVLLSAVVLIRDFVVTLHSTVVTLNCASWTSLNLRLLEIVY